MNKLLICLLSIFTLSAFADTTIKIGVIDAQEVMLKSNRGKQVQTRLEGLQKAKQEQLSSIQDEIKKLEKDLQSPALNPQTREQKSVELQAKRTQFKRLIEDAQREVQMESQKALLELDKQLMPLITNYGKSRGFTAIYDRARSGLVYIDSAIDITADIIREVNASPAQ